MRSKGSGRRTFSLKNRLIKIIIACWILPVLVMAACFGVVVMGRFNSQVLGSVYSTVESAAKLCAERLDAAISSSRYISYNSTVKNAYIQYGRDNDLLSLYQSTDNFLRGNYLFSDSFMFTYLHFFNEGETTELSGLDLYVINESLFSASDSGTGRLVYSEFLKRDRPAITNYAMRLGTSLGLIARGDKLYLVRNLYFEGSSRSAVIIMRLNTGPWFESLKEAGWQRGVELKLAGQYLSIGSDSAIMEIMDETADIDENEAAKLLFDEAQKAWRKEKPGKGEAVAYGGGFAFCGAISGEDYRLQYVVMADDWGVLGEVYLLYFLLIALLLLVVPLLFIVIRFFYGNVSRPLTALTHGAYEIQQDNFGYQVEQQSDSVEFKQLEEAFNGMSAKLKSQFERIYREELALRDARILALQSQINPHFLGNTLEIINWDVRLGNTAKAGRMIEALSTTLDAAMDRSKRPLVHLSQELMYVDSYLYIIGERFGKRLKIEKDIDPGLMDIYVPRLLLQPLIENAVDHGIAQSQYGEIILRGYRKDGDVFLEIENTGEMAEEERQRVDKLLDLENNEIVGPHLGIRNVKERVSIIYGDKSSFEIYETDRQTVLARVKIPYGDEE